MRLDLTPQWSPPLIGGSTTTETSASDGGKTPQWSPPLIGGSTRLASLDGRGNDGSRRNGARR